MFLLFRLLQTMCLLTFSLYMLTQNPDIEKRLRHEVLEKVGPTGMPNYEHMRDMKYMRAFLNGLGSSSLAHSDSNVV